MELRAESVGRRVVKRAQKVPIDAIGSEPTPKTPGSDVHTAAARLALVQLQAATLR